MSNLFQSFVHLNSHSDHSIVNGLMKPKQLIKQASLHQQPALAITDLNFMSGAISFFKEAFDSGVKPIIGVQLNLEQSLGDEIVISKLNLLAKDRQGYLNINKLISEIYTRPHQKSPKVKFADLKKYKEGIIILNGGYYGIVGKTIEDKNNKVIDNYFTFFQEHFKQDFYLALSRCGRKNEDAFFIKSLELAEKYQFPVVAVNDVLFAKEQDFELHNLRMMIDLGANVSNFNPEEAVSKEQYFKSSEQMHQLFADLPTAVHNTILIAQRCNLENIMSNAVLPSYPTNGKTEAEVLSEQSLTGLAKRLTQNNINDEQQVRQYYDRLNFELKVISDMGFAGYFLIVMEFIQWAKNNSIPVGPGRGSGAGSLVAYALTITDIDPLPYKLLFERFLNPERVSMPDFDIDFCVLRRNDVINHVTELYGKDSVSEIMTFGTLAAKGVLKDITRVLGHSYSVGEALSNVVPNKVSWDDPITGDRKTELANLSLCFNYHQPFIDLYNSSEEMKQIIDYGMQLEGVNRQVGKHAAGVVISPTSISDFSAVYANEQGEERTTHYDKSDIEKAGLVKFDFLGLRNLTVIDETLRLINKNRDPQDQIDLATIDLNDSQVFAMLSEGHTHGVFQLESNGMKELIKRLRPSCFEDIIALVALYRPGPLESGMVQNFIDRKHGIEPIHYPSAEFEHPSLAPVLEPTYGVIVYQEQVMQIAQVLAGYSLGQADLLRRAMGKKDVALMREQQAEFMAGAQKNGIDADLAGNIYELVDKFAGYGFNKSHSAAYALIAYHTLYLKKYFLLEFMTALLIVDHDNSDKMSSHIKECRRLNINILPVDINISNEIFTIVNQNILFGIASIKGFRRDSANNIIEERKKNGPFKNIIDFKIRNPELKKNHFRDLNYAGAFDSLLIPGYDRSNREVNQYILEKLNNGKSEYSGDAFGLFDEEIADLNSYLPDEIIPPWTKVQRLNHEKIVFGYYFSGHPLDLYNHDIKLFQAETSLEPIKAEKEVMIKVLKNSEGDSLNSRKRFKFCGMVDSVFIDSVYGKRILNLELSDGINSMKFKYKEHDIEQFARTITENPFVIAEIVINPYIRKDGEVAISTRIHRINTIEQERLVVLKKLSLNLDFTQQNTDYQLTINKLLPLLSNQPAGRHKLTLNIKLPQGELITKQNFSVDVTDGWLSELEAKFGYDVLSLYSN